ncbi:hypothetical protein JVU11DRAFT_10620 [Chiua virens]|nr:hypothetical protein JVU11DRAFT_10620 [Chiua virens]
MAYTTASYGTKGTAIIMQTLLGMFPPTTTPWDAFDPLPYIYFFDYVLVPYTAARLICQDLLSDNPAAGYLAMVDSSDVGDAIHREHDDDKELQAICDRIMTFSHANRNQISANVSNAGNSAKAAGNALLAFKQVYVSVTLCSVKLKIKLNYSLNHVMVLLPVSQATTKVQTSSLLV